MTMSACLSNGVTLSSMIPCRLGVFLALKDLLFSRSLSMSISIWGMRKITTTEVFVHFDWPIDQPNPPSVTLNSCSFVFFFSLLKHKLNWPTHSPKIRRWPLWRLTINETYEREEIFDTIWLIIIEKHNYQTGSSYSLGRI